MAVQNHQEVVQNPQTVVQNLQVVVQNLRDNIYQFHPQEIIPPPNIPHYPWG